MAGPNIGDVVLGIRLDDAALFAGLEASRRRVEGAAPVRIPAPVLPNVAQGAASQALAIQAPPPGLFARINADLDGFRGRLGGVRTAWADFTGSISGAAAIFAGIGLGVLATNLAKTGQQSEQSKLQLNALTSTYGETAQATQAVARVQSVLGVSALQARGDFAQLYAGLRAGGFTTAQLEVLLIGVQKAARLSGASASEASAGFLQLKQGLSSGRLAGDELRSVLENMPILAQAIAKQIGVPVGALRDLGAQGKITTDIIYAAVADLAGREAPPFTAADQIGVAFTNIKEKLAEALGPVAIGLATNLGAVLTTLGRYIEDNKVQIAAFAQGVVNVAGQLAPFVGSILAVVGAFQAWSLAAKATAVAQAAVLALSGPGGIAALAAGLGLAAGAYFAITTASKGAQTAITQTTAKVKAEVGEQQAAFEKVLKRTKGPPGTSTDSDPVKEAAAAEKETQRQTQRLDAQRVERLKNIQSIKDLVAVQAQLKPGGQGLAIAGINPQTVSQVQQIATTMDITGNKFAQALLQGATQAGSILLKANDQFRSASRGAFDLLTLSAQRNLKQQEIDRIKANTTSDIDRGALRDKLGADIFNTAGIPKDFLLDAIDPQALFDVSDQVVNLGEATKKLQAATDANTAALNALINAYATGAIVNVTVPQGSAVGGDAQTAVRYN